MVAQAEKKRELIEESFQEYMGKVCLTEAPADQVREMRRAFFAGIWTMLCINYEIGGEDMPQQVGLDLLEEMIEECQRHKESVLAGVA